MEWVNVNNRLPNKKMRCLVAIGDEVYFAYYQSDENGYNRYFSNDFEGKSFLHFVSYWIEIPEIPNE